MTDRYFDILGGKRVLMGSASPRRRELIEETGVPVELLTPIPADESYPADLPPEEVAPYISRKKAEPYRKQLGENDILVTADTVVISRGKVLGKPAGAAEAAEMLRSLSGHTHHVITGVTLTTTDRQITFAEDTEVEFAELQPDEIDYYISRYRPFDKAGAYGIQEWIGQIGIKAIRGDFYNVMGLPVHRLYASLRELAK